MDYIIQQANRYDINNMQFEQDIIQTVKRNRVLLMAKISNLVKNDIDTQLRLEQLLMEINKVYTGFNIAYKKLLLDKFSIYATKGYENTADLIELGREVSGKLNGKLKELKNGSDYDESTIDYIRQHAFEQVSDLSYQKVSKLRSDIADMMLNGRANKANVRASIEKILGVDKSKAEEITQYELSRAYNYGTMTRMKEYSRVSGEKVRKYWHGFKYSDVTCEYCRDRIGGVYDMDDEEEVLPAHIRCRCVWLPVLESWDTPVSKSLIAKANMLNTAYSTDMIYQRINTRLDINYAEYLKQDAAIDYLSGDRSQKVMNALGNARAEYINDIKNSYGITPDTRNGYMSNEFNSQMRFWKDITASAIADKNSDLLSRSSEALKGVMILPWDVEQLEKWNILLSRIHR
jgi:SPP1 gp7 family putative phage head morphogenesis protein